MFGPQVVFSEIVNCGRGQRALTLVSAPSTSSIIRLCCGVSRLLSRRCTCEGEYPVGLWLVLFGGVFHISGPLSCCPLC